MLTATELEEKYGKIKCKVEDSIDFLPCEISYHSTKTNEMVGYWMYGHFNPEFDYVGQDLSYIIARM